MFDSAYDPRTDDPVPIVLSDPQAEACSAEFLSYLHVDPATTSLDSRPIGAVVEVTGIFDHPAAAGCLWQSLIEGPPVPDPACCRTRFAVIGIESLPTGST